MALYLDNGIIRTYNEQVDHLTKAHRKQLLENDSFQNSINELKELQPKLNELTQRVNTLLENINNIQTDIDNLENSKADIDIVLEKDKLLQSTGQETNNTMSQKAITDAINGIQIPSQLEVLQTTGTSQTAVMSQKATTDAVETTNRNLNVYKEQVSKKFDEQRVEVDRISGELTTAKNDIKKVETVANNANMQASVNLEKINTINGTTIPAINKTITDNVSRIDGDIGSLDATKADASDVVSKTDISQETGNSTTKVMSQDAVTRALASSGSDITVVQTFGNSQTDVMSQKATTDYVNSNTNAVSTILQRHEDEIQTNSQDIENNLVEISKLKDDKNTLVRDVSKLKTDTNAINEELTNTKNNINKVSSELETAKTDIIANTNTLSKIKIKNINILEFNEKINDPDGAVLIRLLPSLSGYKCIFNGVIAIVNLQKNDTFSIEVQTRKYTGESVTVDNIPVIATELGTVPYFIPFSYVLYGNTDFASIEFIITKTPRNQITGFLKGSSLTIID